jgi:hypothetical protein
MLAHAAIQIRIHEDLLTKAQTQRNKAYDDYVNLYLIVDKLKSEAKETIS